jgi:hypothetical protein
MASGLIIQETLTTIKKGEINHFRNPNIQQYTA